MSKAQSASLLKVTIRRKVSDVDPLSETVYENVCGFSPFGPNMIRIDQLVEPEKATSIIQLEKQAKHLFLPIHNIYEMESVDQPLKFDSTPKIQVPQ